MTSRSTRLLLILTVLLAPTFAQAQSQTVGMMTYNDSLSFEGYTLFAPRRSTTTYLIDNYGREVHSWASNYQPSMSVYLLEDGHLLRSIQIPGADDVVGGVQKLSWEGTVVWEYVYASIEHAQHHDIEPLPNGNVLLLASEVYTKEEAVAAGRDPDQLIHNIITPEHIVEVMPTGLTSGDIVWEWHVWDHLVQDFDPLADNYGVVAEHPELIDINYMKRPVADWIHGNSVEYNEDLDQIIMSTKPLNEVWVIDHSTTTAEAAGHSGGLRGMGGDLLYRWGNPETYRAGDINDRQLFGQHDAQWIKPGNPGAGNILCYSNGVDRPSGEYSTVEEFTSAVDSTGQYPQPDSGIAHGPAALLWTFTADPPTSMVSPQISGAHRLPNGNTIICCGSPGWFIEVTPDGGVVWRYQNPVNGAGPMTQGSTVGLGTEAVFRCTRLAPDNPGLAGRDLTPGAALELYPITFSGTTHSPTTPDDDDSVVVTSTITADANLATVQLHIDDGTGFRTTDMFDDGLHHDGAADDSLFGVTLELNPVGTRVTYYIEAIDINTVSNTDPVYAPDNAVYRYVVIESTWLCGDIDNSGSGPDISDLLYLVNFMFQFGPEPEFWESTDVDGNGSTVPDISDLIYLVIFMFQEGPALQCPTE